MRIFGLDLGIDLHRLRRGRLRPRAGETGTILRLGVANLPEARDADGTPLNRTRRTKRMARRQLRRRRERRRTINLLLSSHGLLPSFGSPEWARAMAAKPSALRARALGEPLSAYELGRALYHLAKRRHFRERDLSDASERRQTKPAGPRKPRRAAANASSRRCALRARPSASRSRIATRLRSAARRARDARAGVRGIRPVDRRTGRPPRRAARPAFLGALKEAVFHQRPVFWRKSTLGTVR